MTKTNTALIGPKKTGFAPLMKPPGGAPDGDAALSTNSRPSIVDMMSAQATHTAARAKLTLSTKEIAEELGVSRKKVTAWIRTRNLRTIPGCRPYRIPVTELNRIAQGVLQ